ncbi:MAG: indole-3-glycerol phosphate synthase TrpC [Phycisphaerales bacterium]|nr:indole-3-glycerol phosphate synthase TrpC [Phycisphaerales bacterium]
MNVLAEILAHKRDEVERARLLAPVEALRALPAYAQAPRDFFTAVAAPNARRPNVIAEIKRASPSAGLIAQDFDPVAIARQYAAGGAVALSVLTDARFFRGDLALIQSVRTAVALPVLRKDFIVDSYQIHESRAAGADAILLIAEALSGAQLAEFAALARSLQLGVLIEVHSAEPLAMVFTAMGPRRDGILLGINNRNLATQTIDIAVTEQLSPRVLADLPIVSESGLRTRDDVRRMHAAGARALLIGETLMRSGAPAEKLRELLGE